MLVGAQRGRDGVPRTTALGVPSSTVPRRHHTSPLPLDGARASTGTSWPLQLQRRSADIDSRRLTRGFWAVPPRRPFLVPLPPLHPPSQSRRPIAGSSRPCLMHGQRQPTARFMPAAHAGRSASRRLPVQCGAAGATHYARRPARVALVISSRAAAPTPRPRRQERQERPSGI